MRGKVARALRREARKFAETHDRKHRIGFIPHPFSFLVPEEQLGPMGQIRYSRVSGTHEHEFIADGPRLFYQRLKKAWVRGQIG